MGRPRKAPEDIWFDLFADWSADDQAAALKILAALHRQKLRSVKTAPAEPFAELPLGPGKAEDVDGPGGRE
jgi:hypothetical protein